MQPSNLWVPQRREAGCPPVSETGRAERWLVTWCLLMLAAAGSNLVLIGPVALLPAVSGVCGVVAMTYGVRGLLIVANVTASVFSLLYLALAFVTLPAIRAICTHLEYNVQTCHQCAVMSTVEECHGDTTTEFGPRCYSVETGAACLTKHGLADDCRVAAMQSQPRPPCYCAHDIWDPSWQVRCADLHGYTHVDNTALGYFVLCCMGIWAGIRVGCCDHSQFKHKMVSPDRRTDSARQGNGVAAELRTELVGSSTASIPVSGERGIEQALTPLKVVDGVPDAGWQLHRNRHTPVGQGFEVGERRAVAGDGAVAAIDLIPIALTGVVLQHTPSETVQSPLQGSLVSISRPVGSASTSPTAAPAEVVKPSRVILADQEQGSRADGEGTEL